MSARLEAEPRVPRHPLVAGLVAAAVVWGVTAALRDAWTCDDAFIVFRYARNLVDGLGLVFNAGERVEGYTDLLWVLWTSAAFVLRIDPETWTHVWGIAAYGGAIFLLGLDHLSLVRRLSAPAWAWIPIAALAAASHGDWGIWATSGLETSALTFLFVAGYVALAAGVPDSRRALLTGVIFGLATLLRPDGALLAVVGGLFVVVRARRARPALAYASGFLALCVPAQVFRLVYYGAFVPNTYWAKSAYVAWWGQGLFYLRLYGERYGVFILGPVLVVFAILTLRRDEPVRRAAFASHWTPRVALAAAFAGVYTIYVVRVGGDFMYARLLIPATPFFLVLFELGWTALPRRTPLLGALAIAALPIALPHLFSSPVKGGSIVQGVANEWEFYGLKRMMETDFRGEILRRFFDGLPVRALVYGSEARLAYRARIPTVVEAHGLTDPVIARQPIVRRGRPGHEKWPPPAYVVDDRKVHVAFQAHGFERSRLPAYIPVVPIGFGPVKGFLLHWDPLVLAEWKRRGAVFPDFPAWLDGYVARMPTEPDERVRNEYEKIRHFYFQHVSDPARELPFRTRLRLP
jgi:hypothetical protein